MILESFFFLTFALNGEITKTVGFPSSELCESYRAKVVLQEGLKTKRCESEKVNIRWWYLVAIPADLWSPSQLIWEGTDLIRCYQQQGLYYRANPRGLAVCEGYMQRHDFGMIRDRDRRDLEMRRLKAETEEAELQAEIMRRILRGELLYGTQEK